VQLDWPHSACIALQQDQWEGYYFISGTYARQNKTQESIRWLKQAIEKGFDNWDILEADQNFESIRATSYYKELLKNIGSDLYVYENKIENLDYWKEKKRNV